MKTVARGFIKLIVSYLAVVFVIMILPVFLIAKDASAFDGVINYLFNKNN